MILVQGPRPLRALSLVPPGPPRTRPPAPDDPYGRRWSDAIPPGLSRLMIDPTDLDPGLELETFLTAELGDSTYLLASRDEALLVDPQRDVWRFIEAARRRGWRIRHVLETHAHNDYLSGALEVRSATGAEIVAPVEMIKIPSYWQGIAAQEDKTGLNDVYEFSNLRSFANWPVRCISWECTNRPRRTLPSAAIAALPLSGASLVDPVVK